MYQNIKEKLSPNTGSPEKKAVRSVEFSYYAPQAKKVCLAGNFNAWDTRSLPMKKEKDGVWRITVRLSPGRHEYKYVMDGTWVQDAHCADTVPNSLGSFNCVISV